MKHCFTILAAALLLALPATLRAADARIQKPNILIILADDLGFLRPRLLRLGHCHAESRPAGGGGAAVHPVLQHRALLADAQRPADRLLSAADPHGPAAGPPAAVDAHAAATGSSRPAIAAIIPASGTSSARPQPVADGGFDHSYELDDHDRNFNPHEDSRRRPPAAAGGEGQRLLHDDRLRRPCDPLPEGARREVCGAAVLLLSGVHRAALPVAGAAGGHRPLPRPLPQRLGQGARGTLAEPAQDGHRQLRPGAAGAGLHAALLQARRADQARPGRDRARRSLGAIDRRTTAVSGHEDGHPRRDD